MMQIYVWPYFIALFVFLCIDAVWLTFAGRSIYAAELGALLREKPDFAVAFIFYLVFIAGLVSFVILPAAAAGDIGQAVRMGALFGLVSYATYDLTNLSTINGFTTKIALIDLAWGATISAVVSGITVWLLGRV